MSVSGVLNSEWHLHTTPVSAEPGAPPLRLPFHFRSLTGVRDQHSQPDQRKIIKPWQMMMDIQQITVKYISGYKPKEMGYKVGSHQSCW